MEQKHTPEPWKVVEPTAWPWGIGVVDNKDCLVLRLDMPCYSTSDESLADVMSGKCFDRFGGRDYAAAANAAQMEKARRIVACVNACEGIETADLEKYYNAGLGIDAAMEEASLREVIGVYKQRDQLQQLVGAQVHDIGNGMALLHRMKVERDNLLYALQMMLERIPEPPEANCSCHLSPPCNDCIEYGGEREAFESAKEAIAAVKGGAEC